MWLRLFVACSGDPAGAPCTRTGDSFLARDTCADQCIFWDVACVGGTRAPANVCAGTACTADAECGPGFGCAQTAADAYRCMPATLCPSGFHREPLFEFERVSRPTGPR
jgi:hypothetical protein